MTMRVARIIAPTLTAAALLSCGDATGPGDGGNVTLRFRMATGAAAMHTAGGGLSLSRLALAALPLEGTNGTLTLDELWLVVRTVQLTRTAESCADTGDGEGDGDETSVGRVAFHGGHPGGDDEDRDGDDCVLELGPYFVQVPLEGEGSTEVGVEVEPGTYEAIALQTGAPKQSGDADLLAGIREQFSDWPETASLLVVGTFMPAGGDPVAFRAYFHARIEVERSFADDPLVVEAGGNLTVTVVVDPVPWFTNEDGTVDDLSVYDFDATGEVAEFGMRSKEGCRIDREHD
jgi:hypothetical protein